MENALKLPRPLRIPGTWKQWLFIATMAIALLAVGFIGAKLFSGIDGSISITTETTNTDAQPSLAPSLNNDQLPVVTDDTVLPIKQVADQSLPTTMGELRSTGVVHNSIDSREIRWGWGEFQLSAFERNDVFPPIVGWKIVDGKDNTVAGELLGSMLSTITTIAATPEYAGIPRHTPSNLMPLETIQTAMYIAERIFVIDSEVSELGTQYHLQPKKISSVQIELDKVHGVSKKGLLFSSIITITVEGEEDIRFRAKERFPFYDIGSEFQILK